ncbi:hypothetical protein DCAR_0102379 [Daucus carota subsp. sativus]|uniref:Uncharacterized protein n=1 Tax=Daucus carota subsp. sativus TaxID=79200 RepID=A0A162AIL0_DAUCS|nr:hypothetical protein DCAR_0102379 [Daucus carota subsp. sativus]
MGGNSHKQKKSFSLFSMFKTKKRARRVEDVDGVSDDLVNAYRVYPSDEDRGRWIADRRIDTKASAYIATVQSNWNRSEVSN